MKLYKFLFTIALFLCFHSLTLDAVDNRCPFNSQCECKNGNGITYQNADCPSSNHFPVFDDPNGPYLISIELKITGDVSTIPAKAFLPFKSIHTLTLQQKTAYKALHWDPAAFESLTLTALKILNFPNFLPLPEAFKHLGQNGLQFLRVIGTHERVRLGPNAFVDLPSLISLCITSTLISSIDQSAFAVLRKLTELTLESNSISSFSWTTLAPLDNLKVLGLSGNNIHFNKITNSQIFPKGIEILNLNKMGLTSIPTDLLAHCPKLQTLSLAFNKIKIVKATDLPKNLALWTLTLDGNPIKSINLLWKTASIRTLYLRQTELNSIDLNLFRGARLQIIDLSNTKSLKSLSRSFLASPFELVRVENTGLEKIDSNVRKIFEDKQRVQLEIKDNKHLKCTPDMRWMAKWVFGSNGYGSRILLNDGSWCEQQGKTLSVYLNDIEMGH